MISWYTPKVIVVYDEYALYSKVNPNITQVIHVNRDYYSAKKKKCTFEPFIFLFAW